MAHPTYMELLKLKRIIAVYPTREEAFDVAKLIMYTAVFYSDGSERQEGWEVWA